MEILTIERDALAENVQGTLLLNQPLARYTSWRVGGCADRFFRPVDREDLAKFIHQLPADEPIYWLGLGSNTLVRDGGIRGTVIATQGALNSLQSVTPQRVRAEAGVACAKFARFCARHGLEGVEFFAGIPGTIGGALAMNAGAHGGETWQYVASVEVLTRTGDIRQRFPSDYQIGYRSVQGPPEEWFLGAEFEFTVGNVDVVQTRIRDLLQRRMDTQPINLPNGGSVFCNPPSDYAARLIESCGLKGVKLGGAAVSEKHANFIVNELNATAADIENLIYHVRDRVFEATGVRLTTEVRIVGESL